MTRWRHASWPVIFAVCTVLFAVLSYAYGQVARDSSQGLPLAAPLFGAAMTWWFVRQRNEERVRAGFDAGQHAAAERAVLRGELPPDPAGWPGARTLVARQREQLHRYRSFPLLFGLVGLAFLGLGLGGGGRSDYTVATAMLGIALVGSLSSARLRRRLDSAEAALDAAENRPGSGLKPT
jgi:drug/metabolite transporter (DMT)-like permease